MNRGTGFSFDTMEQKADFAAYAKSKGMTLSQLVKVATFAYRAKNRAGSHHKTKTEGRKGAPPATDKK